MKLSRLVELITNHHLTPSIVKEIRLSGNDFTTLFEYTFESCVNGVKVLDIPILADRLALEGEIWVVYV